MPHNTQFDSFEPQTLDFPYSRVSDELSEDPRFVRGKNFMVSLGGKVARRPGTMQMLSGNLALRADRAWFVETLDTPPVVYMVVSAFNAATGFWELWHVRLNDGSTLAKSGTYRDVDKSTAPHTAAVSRGMLFIKGTPAADSTEKLGSVVFDGTAGVVTLKPWGLLGPTNPAQLSHTVIGTLPAAITAFTLTFSIGDMCSLGECLVGDVIQLDYEQIKITGISISGGITTVTVLRGFNGTASADHLAGTRILDRSGWNASAHVQVVQEFWEYSYGWKTSDGHYSNRAPVNINPDTYPSRTGPFFNQRPQITVWGNGDTNVTKIAIYRTTDGGGTFYLLDEINNPGDQSVNYEDNSLGSGSLGTTYHDPLPDAFLSTNPPAPGLTSNSPPPTVLAPKVTGTNTPSISSPIAYFQGRFWYAIGNVVFYSAQEELILGIPEHAFPSDRNGNFVRYQHPVTNLGSTDDALYVFTLQGVHSITGSTRDSFNTNPKYDNYGHPFAHPRAVCRFGAQLAFLTHDYRIALITGGDIIVNSDSLGTDLVDQINAGGEIEISYFADLDKEYLVVSGHMAANPARSKQWIYDLKKSMLLTLQGGIYSPRKHFWFLPWTYPSTVCVSGRISESTTQRRLVFFSWDNTAQKGVFARMDPTGAIATDYTSAGVVNFDLDAVVHLHRVPTGNHVNARRQPELTSVLYSLVIERTLFAGDEDPQVYWFADDLWTDPQSADLAEDPARRILSKAYKTSEYHIWNAGQRFAFEITKANSPDRLEIHTYNLVFAPDSGA